MMIARIHYDEATLDRLRFNQLGNDEDEVLQHVETCEVCQAKLETRSTDGLSWDDVQQLFSESNSIAEMTPDCDTTDASADRSFLEPVTLPGYIGRFGRYEVKEILGQGGMGIVLRALDPSLDRHCAVKVLAPSLATNGAARKRFSREAKSAAAVVHPHVVPIQTVDEHNGLPYLVMPIVEGRSLQQRVNGDGPLGVTETIRIAGQIAQGLAAAHDQGLVHRDIKPANVLLENGVERVQITDFGLARAVDDASMTQSGVISGTPQYMSPEQAHGDSVDTRSDLFSLGSVMYFMLTGRSPFRAETTMGVLKRIIDDEPRLLEEINSDVPPWLSEIISRLLSKNPEQRFQSASEVASVLAGRLVHLQSPAREEDHARTSQTQNACPKATNAPRNPWRSWIITACFAPIAALFGLVVILETRKGTVRIENHSGKDIAMIVRQGEEEVERITLRQEDTVTRLKAGPYHVEFQPGQEPVSIENGSFDLKPGGQCVVKIGRPKKADIDNVDMAPSGGFRDPSAVYKEALADVHQGRNELALERILWCWREGTSVQPAWFGVRHSFLTTLWLDLADSYPAALEALVTERDRLRKKILEPEQLRVSLDDFSDLAHLNECLRNDLDTWVVYLQMHEKDQNRLIHHLPEYPKVSAFTRMEFHDEKVLVDLNGNKYELLRIEPFAMEELIALAEKQFGDQWKKRVSEDLFEVLITLGEKPDATLSIQLRSIDEDKQAIQKEVLMTEANRSKLYRDNEHNQP